MEGGGCGTGCIRAAGADCSSASCVPPQCVVLFSLSFDKEEGGPQCPATGGGSGSTTTPPHGSLAVAVCRSAVFRLVYSVLCKYIYQSKWEGRLRPIYGLLAATMMLLLYFTKVSSNPHEGRRRRGCGVCENSLFRDDTDPSSSCQSQQGHYSSDTTPYTRTLQLITRSLVTLVIFESPM
jgi:hypothetical protein